MRGDLSNPNCASREVFEHVMGRWGGLILRALLRDRLLRFAALRASVGGISEKMLAQSLKQLERDGLVQRVSYNEIPPRVEYSMTPLGSRVAARIVGVCEVIEEETLAITKNQASFDKADQRRPWQTARVPVSRD
jgi:DNA-binding HxlR family transcriptional regulator